MPTYVCQNCLKRSSISGHYDFNLEEFACQKIDSEVRPIMEAEWKEFFAAHPEE